MNWQGQRSEEERERARLEREARRAGRAGSAPSGDGADPAAAAAPPPPPRDADPPTRVQPPSVRHPHLRDRVEAALARSKARRSQAPPRTPRRADPATNGDAPMSRRIGRRARGPLALILVAVAVVWFLVSLYQPGKGDGAARVTVTVPRGADLGIVAQRLDAAGVISSRFFFKLRARLAGHTSDLKPGVYVLRKDMAYSTVLAKLTAGVRLPVIQVTIPEGRARGEVAPLLKQAGVKGNYIRATAGSRLLSPRRYGAPHGAT